MASETKDAADNDAEPSTTTYKPRKPLTQQSRLGGDDPAAPDVVPTAKPKKPFNRWMRR